MATRFYFPETEDAPVSPAIQGTYAHTNTLRRKLLRATPDSSTLTTTAYAPDGADHLVAGAAHHRQYVSDALAAQNISGTWKLQIQALEANAGNNQALNILIFVCDSAGTTIKETLVAQVADASEFNTALRNITMSGTITAADIEANDRIVVQVGCSGTPTGAGGVQGHNASLRWGCNASSGDLPENETETGTTYRAWIEFSDDITLPSQQFQTSFAATAIGVADIAEATTFRRSFAAAAIGVASISTRFIAGVSFQATAVGVATVSALARFKQSVAGVGTAIASLATQFIEGQGGYSVSGCVGEFFMILRERISWRP